MNTNNENLFYIKILSLSGEIFSGDIYSFSAKNVSGDFDILKSHTNFISLLEKGEIKYRAKGFMIYTNLDINNGLLIFEDDKAEVFINF
jgi:F0F1-type ATP synthase epsilon subunit